MTKKLLIFLVFMLPAAFVDASDIIASIEPVTVEYGKTAQIDLKWQQGVSLGWAYTKVEIVEGFDQSVAKVELKKEEKKVYITPLKAGTTQAEVFATLFGGPGLITETHEKFTITVTPKGLTIIKGEDITKVYDGKNNVTTENTLQIQGQINEDDVKLGKYELYYDDEHVGINKPITIPALSLEGNEAGNYTVNNPVNLGLKGNIVQKELTITPDANQWIYNEEASIYESTFTHSGEIEGEKPAFSGKLGVQTPISIGSLVLIDHASFKAKNYKIELKQVALQIKTGNIPVEITGQRGTNHWYISNVTLTPKDDVIEIASANNAGNWLKELNITEEGDIKCEYLLKRKGQKNSIERSQNFKIDKTVPTLNASVQYQTYKLTFNDATSGIDKLFVNNQEVTIPSGDDSYKGSLWPGTYKAKVTDIAGHSTEIEFTTSRAPIETFEIDLDKIYGVTTNPDGGLYSVNAGDDFSFTAQKDSWASKDTLVVTVNGEELKPISNDTYKITAIRKNLEIIFELKPYSGSPVSIEKVKNGFNFYTRAGELHIETNKRITGWIYTPTGALIANPILEPGSNRIPLRKGIYLLKFENGETGKIIIR